MAYFIDTILFLAMALPSSPHNAGEYQQAARTARDTTIQDITQVQPDFEEFCRAVAVCFANGNIAEINKVVHPDGMYTIYRIGVPDVFTRAATLDTNLQRTFPYHYPIANDQSGAHRREFQYEQLPEYDCGEFVWRKDGIFVDTTTVHRQLSDIVDFAMEYEEALYSEEDIDAIRALEANSRRVVFTANDLIMHVTNINGKWYLSVVDLAMIDCSA